MSPRSKNAKSGTRLVERKGAFARLVRCCQLRVLVGPDAGKEATFSQRHISVGTREDCDLVLSDSSVSGHHLELSLEEQGVALKDLGSTNGTFIGPLLVGEAVLAEPTRLVLGESELEFVPLPREVEQALPTRDRLGDLLGQSPAMREVFGIVEKAGPSDATVLITGETGTGKELVAEAIHRASRRAAEPFVVVDCTAVPHALFESELFGHVRGAFTGAVAAHRGAFERAHGGSVFLDEITDLDPALQPKLLRVLERRRVQRVGSESPVEVDVRVIAASRRDLSEEVRRGRFRDDLYYRLAVVRIPLPALRQRKEDIPLLASYFIHQTLGRDDAAPAADLSRHLSAGAIDRLLAHDWPGNVRELRNAIERALVLETDPLQDTPPTHAGPTGPEQALSQLPFQVAKKVSVEAFERGYLTGLLQQRAGNVSRCARAAGMDRRNFQRLLRRHGLDPSAVTGPPDAPHHRR